MTTLTFSRDFVWKRLHSLMGLWLVLFLMEHLFVNSQAALLLGENGRGFVEAVNAIHNLPYLYVIELFLLGIPLLIHMVWGVRLLFTSKANASRSDGSRPSLPQYGRNKAYSWQRITSWILLVGVAAHVVKFRFLDYPWSVNEGQVVTYFVKIHSDEGLHTLTDKLGFKIYNQEDIKDAAEKGALEKKSLQEGEVIAATNSFGTASLLSVRDTFKVPLYAALYTIFVLAACFHGFNGFWTFLLTWGAVIKVAAQKRAYAFALGLMFLVAFLGLAAIWGTYWLNLKS